MTSLKQGFLSDLKTHIGRVPDGEFFWQLARGEAFSFPRVKNGNCEFLQNLCTDFLRHVLNPETPKRNHPSETTETTEKAIKTWTKRSRQPQWHHRYWIPGGLSSIIISRIVSSDFPASVVLLSESLQFPKHKKSEIKRFFYFSIYNSKHLTQCKGFSHDHTAATNKGTSGHRRLADFWKFEAFGVKTTS